MKTADQSLGTSFFREPSLSAPQPKLDVLESRMEVIVRAEQDKIVFERELDQHGVDRSDLDAMAAAGVADFSSFNMVFSIWLNEAKRSEPFDQLTAGLGSCKALKKFLQHETCRKDLVRSIQCVVKRVDLGCCSLSVAAKCERPYAGINEKAHGLRARSAL